MYSEYCKNKPDIDTHSYLTPICQKKDCGRPGTDFPHNDIVNEEYMDEKHELVMPTEPLIWGENAYRVNDCYSRLDDYESDCQCLCHWGQYYINVYELDRNYGGPEEGGWWYDSGEPILSVPFDTIKEAYEYRDKMEVKFPRTHKSSSVLYNGGDYSVVMERRFAEAYPNVTPRYE